MYFLGILNEFIQFYAKRRFFKKEEYLFFILWKNLLKLWKTQKSLCRKGYNRVFACGKLLAFACQALFTRKSIFYDMHKSRKKPQKHQKIVR